MVLVAVIIGYLLGIAPFTVPKVIERIDKNKTTEVIEDDKKEQLEILDEYLNGPKVGVNQEDIYNEYITGKETVKGD